LDIDTTHAEHRPIEVASPLKPTPRAAGPARFESRAVRCVYACLALLICGGFFYATHQYWVPAHPGVDQNGYLVGGRLFAETFSMGYTPDDPFEFVGRMWIGTPWGTFYPKYPLGLPFLIATTFWAGGNELGPWLTYWINPVCMTLSLLATFVLVRMIAGSFGAVIGMILLACSPVTLLLTNNPNSHASTVCCVTWGMVLLLQWWKTGGMARAVGAGLLIGFAATIRYTEGLLILPVLMIILYRLTELNSERKRVGDIGSSFGNPKSAFRNGFNESFMLLVWWTIPLLTLVCFNLHWFGDITGYDSTNESTGFSFEWFEINWTTMLGQLNATAVYFVLPLSVLGLVRMVGRDWKLASILMAWALPTTLLYMAYYWAPDNTGVSYMRFMLTILPALIAGAVWFVSQDILPAVQRGVTDLQPLPTRPSRGVWSAVLLGVVGAIGGAYSLGVSTTMLENDHRRNIVLDNVTTQARLAGVNEGAVVIGEESFLHHIQFAVKNLRVYSTDAFNRSSIQRMVSNAQVNRDNPQGLQPDRALAMGRTVGKLTDNDLIRRQNQIVDLALRDERRVFLIGSKRTIDQFSQKFLTKKVTTPNPDKTKRPVTETVPLYTTAVVRTWDEISDLRRDRAQRLPVGAPRPARPNNSASGVAWQVVEITPLGPTPTTSPTVATSH